MVNLARSFASVTYSRRQIGQMLLLYAAYIIAAQLGYFLFTAPAVIQPAAGIALAGLALGGISLWPAIFAAAFTNLLVLGVDPLPLAFSTLGQTLHAVIGAYLLQIFNFDPIFRRVRDTFLFIVVALTASMITPSLGLIGHYLNMQYFGGSAPSVTWISWWSGIMISDLILAVALIRHFAKRSFERTRWEIFELVAAYTILGLMSYLVAWTDASRATSGVLIIFFILPFIWFSLRLGNRFTFFAFLMATAILLTGVMYGGVPSSQSIGYRIVATELFMAVLAAIFFLFTAVVEERKRSGRQLVAQLARVENLLTESKRADQAKSDFIAIFAHELRNPLAPIVSSVELLKLKWGINPELADIVSIIEDRTRTIVRLLDDLLDISRINGGKLRLKREHADAGTIVRRAAVSILPSLEARSQTFDLSVPTEWLMLDVDPVRIEQVVSNLLSNASKFTPDGGHIHLSVERDRNEAVITITDNGIGIEQTMLQRIFEPFMQVERGHRINEGLGIGLSLTQKLVEVHGGTITAHSDGLHQGAKFVVRLPLALNAAAITHNHHTTMTTTSPLRVLIVDDNEAAANGLCMLLRHVGNTVECAYLGHDVAKKNAEFKPDVIVLDIGLPDMSGYEVAEQLRKDGFRGRIIALTGYGQDEDKRKSSAAGFDHHLTKPVGLIDLQAAIVPQTL